MFKCPDQQAKIHPRVYLAQRGGWLSVGQKKTYFAIDNLNK